MKIEGLPIREDPHNELIYRLVDAVQIILVFSLFWFVIHDLKTLVGLCILGLIFSVYVWRHRR